MTTKASTIRAFLREEKTYSSDLLGYLFQYIAILKIEQHKIETTDVTYRTIRVFLDYTVLIYDIFTQLGIVDHFWYASKAGISAYQKDPDPRVVETLPEPEQELVHLISLTEMSFWPDENRLSEFVDIIRHVNFASIEAIIYQFVQTHPAVYESLI